MLRVIKCFAKSLKSLEMVPFDISHTSISVLYCGPILRHFLDKARYWSKIAIFHTLLHSTFELREFLSEYCYNVWCGKTIEWHG